MIVTIDLSKVADDNLIALHNMAYALCATEYEAIELTESIVNELDKREIGTGISDDGKLYKL